MHILDNNAYRFPIDAVRQGLKEEGSQDIIGITGLITQFKFIQTIAKVCREEHPAALIVGGGGWLSSMPFEMMKWIPELDIGAVGEAYITWREILKHAEDRNWSKVKGLVYREGKKVKLSSMRPLIEEYYYCEEHKSERLTFEKAAEADFTCKCGDPLVNNLDEQIPWPAYEFSPVETYLKYSPIPYSMESSGMVPLNVGEGLRRLDVMSSLGCPWNCSFCHHVCGSPSQQSKLYGREVTGKAFRQHSPKYVVGLIDHLRRKWSVNFVSFIDENFTVNKKWFYKFCETLEEADLATLIHWGVVGHSRTVDKEMLVKGHDVGMSYISYGGESGSARLLKEMGKGQTPEQMSASIEATHAAQINPIMSFIIGFPDETIEDVIATLQFFIDNQIHCNPFFLQPYPATALYEQYKDKIIEQYMTEDELAYMKDNELRTSLMQAYYKEAPKEISSNQARKLFPELQTRIHDEALKRWVLSLDDATRMSCNLTAFTDVELAGMRYLLSTEGISLDGKPMDLERLKQFKRQLEERTK